MNKDKHINTQVQIKRSDKIFGEITYRTFQKENMKMNLSLILFIIKVLSIIVKGIIAEDFNSDFSQSFGCLEKTQVTVFVPRFQYNLDLSAIDKLYEHLSHSNNCHTLFMFMNDIKKSLPFKNGSFVRAPVLPEHKALFLNEAIIDIIQDEQFVNDPSTRQILLIVQGHWEFSDKFWFEALEKFDNKTDRDVIIYCHYNYCPVEHNIPFHRIVPDFRFEKDNVRQLIDLVNNPNFNRFENLKHAKLYDDERLKCLINKTIHIELRPTISLLESILVLAYNTERFSDTKIIYYTDVGGYQYLAAFAKYFGFKGRLRMVLGYTAVLENRFEKFSQNTDDIYLIQHIDHYKMSLKFCKLSVQGRKAFIYYGTVLNNDQECWNRFQRLTLTEMDFYEAEFHHYYADDAFVIEEVLKVSCF